MPQPDTLAVVDPPPLSELRRGLAEALAKADFAEDSPFRRSRRDFLTGALNELNRVGVPLPCRPDKAFDFARGCIRANEAIKQKARLTI